MNDLKVTQRAIDEIKKFFQDRNEPEPYQVRILFK